MLRLAPGSVCGALPEVRQDGRRGEMQRGQERLTPLQQLQHAPEAMGAGAGAAAAGVVKAAGLHAGEAALVTWRRLQCPVGDWVAGWVGGRHVPPCTRRAWCSVANCLCGAIVWPGARSVGTARQQSLRASQSDHSCIHRELCDSCPDSFAGRYYSHHTRDYASQHPLLLCVIRRRDGRLYTRRMWGVGACELTELRWTF